MTKKHNKAIEVTITANGETKTFESLKEAATYYGINHDTFKKRYAKGDRDEVLVRQARARKDTTPVEDTPKNRSSAKRNKKTTAPVTPTVKPTTTPVAKTTPMPTPTTAPAPKPTKAPTPKTDDYVDAAANFIKKMIARIKKEFSK